MKVTGTKTQAQSMVIGLDTIYLHTNIKYIGEGLYEYEETQMPLREYILEHGNLSVMWYSEEQAEAEAELIETVFNYDMEDIINV